MSGHSKWANIRIRKGAQDSKRGKIYTRHARLIEIAAQRGGDPAMNSSLRTAIENAKADNVPNANIDRAVKKGTGELKGEAMAEILYGAMGPGGTALLLECLTDNRNRTINNIRNAGGKNGASWTELSSILWMFERKAIIVGERVAALSDDDELALIDAGADDIEREEGAVTVTAHADKLGTVRDALLALGYTIKSAGLKYVAKQTVAINDKETAEALMQCIDAIEEDDDIAEIHTNAEIAEEIAASL